MHPLFNITIEQVRKLNDEQARELIARLCRAQIEHSGLGSSCVLWGGNQRAADEGVDVRVDSKPAQDVGGPLARSVAVVQVKAELFGPAKIEPEMTPKGFLRPAIASLAPDGGIYLIASTRDDPADPARRKRVAAMKQVLSAHGLVDKISVDFIGARQIADWVEQFPPLAIWLRQQIRSPLQGWQGCGPWAYKEIDPDAEFLLGKETRVFAPGSTRGMTNLEAIDTIRADLTAGKSVRLVGLSGVGKTRLAQALFDKRIETRTPALPADWAIYTDISDRPEPQPEAMIGALAQVAERSVLIVDNCGQATHSALVERKGKFASKLGLLTIEYDIQDDLPDETRCYRLEGSSSETMRELLKERYPKLSSNDLDVVIDSSDGNARLAFALASTSEQTGDLSSLHDRELFRRLFEQKAGNGDELLRCAKAASLIYSFDGIDTSEGSELSVLCKFSGTTQEIFLRHMAELRRRGLLQSRGKMRALLPHAVSNRLAADAIEEATPSLLEQNLMDTSLQRVRASFAHRLSYLHNSPGAQALVAKWTAPNGHFSELAYLSNGDWQVFRRLAVVQPESALATIEKFAKGDPTGERTSPQIEEITRLVQAIAYDPALFDRCIATMLDLLPLQDVDRNTGKPPLNHLKSLFQLVFSGTHARAPQRAAIVEQLIGSKSADKQMIGVELLAQALKVGGSSNHISFRFGARKRDYGWWPETIDEQRAWHLRFLAITEQWAPDESELGTAVRSALGRAIGGLIQDADLAQTLFRLAPRLIQLSGWLEAWKSVNRLLKRKDLNSDTRKRAATFEQIVAPNSLRARVLATIMLRDYIAREDEDANDPVRSYEQSQLSAKRIGEELATDSALLGELIPQLLNTEAKGNVFYVGIGVGKRQTDISAVMAEVRKIIEKSSDPKTVNLAFVRGLISGWKDSDPEATAALLDNAVEDQVLGPWFPELQTVVPIDERGVERLQKSLRIGLAPTWQYNYLSVRLGHAPIEDVQSLLIELAAKSQGGAHCAIDALHMMVYGAKEQTAPERKKLGALCRDFLTQITWPDLDDHGRLDYELEHIISFATTESGSFDDMQNILDRAVDARIMHPRYYHGTTGNFLAPIIRRYPTEALTHLFGRECPEHGYSISDLILQESPINDAGSRCPVVPDEVLLRWCKENPSGRISFTARICDLSEPVENASLLVNNIFDLAADKSAFIGAVAERFLSSTLSDREIPHMHIGLSILKSLPASDDTSSKEALRLAIKNLTQRIDWWQKMTDGTGRDRDESFE